MADDFNSRMDALAEQVGVGVLSAQVVVDQVYAKYQELRDDLELHGGGRHHYTRDALFDNVDRLMEMYAEALITEDGSDLKSAAEKVAEAIAAGVYQGAPFEFGDLKASPHPTVTDDGEVIYDRAPAMHRLDEDELRAKGDLRRLGFGNDTSRADLERGLGVG